VLAAGRQFRPPFFVPLFYLYKMLEYISWLVYHIFKSIILETFFMGLARLIAWPGFRIYSIFTKERSLSYKELRKKYITTIWPYLLILVFWAIVARMVI